jgi:hypothetical protein
MLADVMVYFDPAIKKSSWNTFSRKVENKTIPIPQAIFMTDEEKNPELFDPKFTSKRVRTEILSNIREIRNKVKHKFEQQKKDLPQIELVVIPDLVRPQNEPPTIYTLDRIRALVQDGKVINDLTGQQFPWEIIDMVRSNKPNTFKFHLEHCKQVDNDTFLKLLSKELVRLDKIVKKCATCKNKLLQGHHTYKTLYNYQIIRFCSQKCFNDFDDDNQGTI